MALIKAGTYRFNDVIETTYRADADINFTFAGYNAEYGINITAYCDSISSGYTGEAGGYSVEPSYHLVSTSPDIGMESTYYIVYGSDSGWENDTYGMDLQTITVTEDTEVSEEFYAWFMANTVEQKQISGVWRFKDVLIAPSKVFEQSVAFTLSGLIEFAGVDFVARCSVMEWMHDDEFNVDTLEYYVNYTDPSAGLDNNWVWVYENNEWNNSIGEALKTIDFGTEPQTVSAEFYEWLKENAVSPDAEEEKPLAAITYNGTIIATLNGGQTATLKCAGMTMESDVVVEMRGGVVLVSAT